MPSQLVQRFRPILFALLLALLPIAQSKRFNKANDAVLLSSVKSLTFHADRDTNHRRVSAIPELNCIGGSGCRHYKPDVIRCTASGSSYSSADVEWTCKADLPLEFKLGSTDVVCEGYDSPDDDFVLKGSCGLEYRLILTEAGVERFGKSSSSSSRWEKSRQSGSWIPNFIFWVLFLGVVFIMARAALRNSDTGAPRLGGTGGGGGYGGNDDDDPPPPYSPQPPRKPRTTTSSYSRQANSADWFNFGNSRGTGSNYRPGFWSGAATGAAAASAASYFAGNRQNQARSSNYDTGEGPSRQPARGGSFGGGGVGSGGSAPSFSPARHESTGFGGTRRR